MRPLRDLLGLVLVPAALLAALLLPDHARELPVEDYEDGGTPLYLDRAYVNRQPSAALDGLRVVRIPRHLRFDVVLEIDAPARVVRLLTEKNDNAVFSGWDPLPELALRVEGHSCVFTRAVDRQLAAGTHRLAPGGPVAASPILVAGDAKVRAGTLRSWNKLTPGAGPLDFVLRNKRKLAGLGLLYAGWVWGYGRVGRRRGEEREKG